MDSKVATLAATSGSTYGQQSPKQSPPDTNGTTAERVAQGSDPADLRLVIEEDKASHSYIYKTVNRLTGEVVQQLPRDQVLKLREQVEYVAGTVVRTQA